MTICTYRFYAVILIFNFLLNVWQNTLKSRYTAVPKAQKVESEKARKTSSKKKKKKVVQEVPGVPDDAPTVLKEIVAKERAGQPVNFEQEQEPVEEKNGCCRII